MRVCFFRGISGRMQKEGGCARRVEGKDQGRSGGEREEKRGRWKRRVGKGLREGSDGSREKYHLFAPKVVGR